jgi:hypothetical protein
MVIAVGLAAWRAAATREEARSSLAKRARMAEHDEKPWWRRLDGMPPTTKLDEAAWRHPARYGVGLGVFQFVAWLFIAKLIFGASWAVAFATASVIGSFWAGTQTMVMKAQAQRRRVGSSTR